MDGINRINGISGIDIKIPSIQTITGKQSAESVFAGVYRSALNMINETNALSKQAEAATNAFAVGKLENVETLMIMQEKASIALQYTTKIRDSVLQAYNEIMRLQV